jgi:glycosyltransferase involved in cell wall biosynthesis
MAIGLPSISTNVFAIPEAVIHEQTGLLTEAGNSPALAESVLRLKNDPELRTALSRAGSNFVLEHFDERIAAEAVIRSYKNCFE